MDQIFSKLGLDNSEIKVYSSLLTYGRSKVNDLAKYAKIDRRSCYDVLNRLIGKNFVSSIEINKVKFFEGINPDLIISNFKDIVAELEAVLPKLHEIGNNNNGETKVTLLKGLDGLKMALNDIVNVGQDYVGMGAAIKFFELLPVQTIKIMKQIEAKGLKERGIFPRDILQKLKNQPRDLSAYEKVEAGEYRYLDNEYTFPTTFIQYGDKVLLFIWQSPYYVIMVENKDIAESYKNYFEFFWKYAKEQA